MHHLLVAIDGSDSAERALAYAVKLANGLGDTVLHLVTVLPDPLVYGEIEVYVSKPEMAAMQRDRGEELLKPGCDTAASAGVRFTSDVLIGDTPHEIVGKSRQYGCEGIIMGTRGTGAIASLMMGSVATKVIHLTKLPVTLVR